MVIANWLEVLNTCNLSPGRKMDPLSRWLIITRACVFNITVFAWLIGTLLAAADGPISWVPSIAALLGLVIAHAANNMINDYFDLSAGVDSAEYPRALYAPHPVLGGLVSRTGLRNAIFTANALDLALLVYLTTVRGLGIVGFALAGLFISVFYVAPPLRLKHRGMGEISVFIVWGPLMVGGTYLVSAGSVSTEAILCSLPYAFLIMTALVGKHIDKLSDDRARGIRTLPVLLGGERSLVLNRALLIGFYVLTLALVITNYLGAWVLLIFLSIPRLLRVLKTYASPRPDAPPEGFPLWPLWYVAWAFHLTRLAGGLLVLGMLLNVIYPITLPF